MVGNGEIATVHHRDASDLLSEEINFSLRLNFMARLH